MKVFPIGCKQTNLLSTCTNVTVSNHSHTQGDSGRTVDRRVKQCELEDWKSVCSGHLRASESGAPKALLRLNTKWFGRSEMKGIRL